MRRGFDLQPEYAVKHEAESGLPVAIVAVEVPLHYQSFNQISLQAMQVVKAAVLAESFDLGKVKGHVYAAWDC